MAWTMQLHNVNLTSLSPISNRRSCAFHILCSVWARNSWKLFESAVLVALSINALELNILWRNCFNNLKFIHISLVICDTVKLRHVMAFKMKFSLHSYSFILQVFSFDRGMCWKCQQFSCAKWKSVFYQKKKEWGSHFLVYSGNAVFWIMNLG